MPGRVQPSVHMAPFLPPESKWLNPQLAGDWQRLLAMRAEVNKALDMARKDKLLGNSLDARLLLCAPGQAEFISAHLFTLEEICMVSQIELLPKLPDPTWQSQEMAGLSLKIELSPLPKCPRCWKRRPGTKAGGLCPDCTQAVERWAELQRPS
jgi:isoleucyl-tRNA synthetase